jgi:hypothetical protein
MEYDQTYRVGKSIIYIVGPKNLPKNIVEAILEESHDIAREIIQETAESIKIEADTQS